MERTLEGDVAIVTGASSGIGAATARELARRGARIVLAARRARELEAQAQAIIDAGGEAVAIPTDVADLEQVERLVERAQDAFGQVDVLVNNAGANWTRPVTRTSEDDMVRLLDVNLMGAMLLTRAALPGMLERRYGAIVSVSSVAGSVAIEPLYSATKYGVRGFSFGLRRQLSGSGVTVSLVSPGNIRTEMTRGMDKQMPGPELVAGTIADLIVHPRREVIVPVQHNVLRVMEQAFPGLVDLAFHWRHWSKVD
jgi:NAD(P)-dependent dehydrogenase (short-subunit alcohol dehydrogenase family)